MIMKDLVPLGVLNTIRQTGSALGGTVVLAVATDLSTK
jgi:hypothetical protein